MLAHVTARNAAICAKYIIWDYPMLKRFSVALAALFVLATSAFGAGTLPGFSLSQQMGKDGKPLAGCILKFYQAGTVATPQTAYQDSGLTIPVSGGAQMTCDAFGRIGQFFLADGSIKILLTDVNGVTQVTADGLLVIGASSGGGGGSPVDPTTVLAPCDIKVVYGTGVVTGFVRMNGRTIGNAVSGATERANADTLAAFSCLYANDNNLVVSGGRGASAAADYAAGKTIATPDYRGRALAGLDDMGNSAAGRLGVTFSAGNSTTLGSTLGVVTQTIGTANLPPYTPTGSISTATGNATPTRGIWRQNDGHNDGNISSGLTGTLDTQPIPLTMNTQTFTGTAQGGTSTPIPTIQPTLLITVYVKL